MSVFKKPERATVDFETRSTVDLRKHGTWRYATSPTTQPLVMAWRLPYWTTGRTEIWTPEYPDLGIDQQGGNWDALFELFEWVQAGKLVEAHNAWFERNIWRHIMVARYGWPEMPKQNWRCSAAQAAACSLPRGLDDALAAMRLALRKDATGAKVMMKMTKPRKPRKAERESWQEQHGAKPMSVLYHEDRHLLMQLFDYVRQDVLAEEGLSYVLPDLSDDELEMYWLDQEMNDRGFQLDMEAVDAALYLIQEESLLLNAELADVTDGQVVKATQRAQLQIWLELEGVNVDNTQAATLDALLEDWPTTGSVRARRAVEILRTLGRSSTSKYEAMRAQADLVDGRVRGGLLYHGASTGRWTGVGVQPQNFPKGGLKNPMVIGREETPEEKNAFVSWLWDNIKTLDRPYIIDTHHASMMEVLSHALRSAIVAGPGTELFVADYASIEARVVLWLAGDETALDVFRRGEDIYLYTAEGIYHRPITKADKQERQMGKQACLGADTLVLTERGWMPIIHVRVSDRVWDGTAWVAHEGVVCNGAQETFNWLGVDVTPDHKILTSEGQWQPASEVAQSEFIQNRALATGLVNLPSTAYSVEGAEGCQRFTSPVLVGSGRISSMSPIFVAASRPDATRVQWLRQLARASVTGATRIFSRMMGIGSGYLTALAQSLRAARTRATRAITTMVDAVFVSILRGWLATGMADAAVSRKGDVNFWRISSHCPDGTTPLWNWTAATTSGATSPITFASSHAESTWTTADRSEKCKSASSTWKPVFDIVNAGARHRFTIWTDRGPLIVHNCLGLGYQMGAPKFVDTVAKYGIVIDEGFARQVVEAYREKYWRTKQLWGDLERSAVECVKTKRSVECGKLTWHYHHEFLWMELPSGRMLAYPFPWVSMQETSWGAQKETLQFRAVNPKTRQWGPQKTYGGMLVENATQAVARDLIAHSLKLLEAHPVYTPILSVHDEGIAEAPIGRGDVKEFEHLMATTPDWAYGLPVAAEAWAGPRYRK